MSTCMMERKATKRMSIEEERVRVRMIRLEQIQERDRITRMGREAEEIRAELEKIAEAKAAKAKALEEMRLAKVIEAVMERQRIKEEAKMRREAERQLIIRKMAENQTAREKTKAEEEERRAIFYERILERQKLKVEAKEKREREAEERSRSARLRLQMAAEEEKANQGRVQGKKSLFFKIFRCS